MAREPLHWPAHCPEHGPVVLRPWTAADLPTVAELSADPYVPLLGTIPVPYSPEAGLAYVARQHQRLAEGSGWSFAVGLRTGDGAGDRAGDGAGDLAVGGAGLWLHPDRAATAGYVLVAGQRRRGYGTAALTALTAFAGEQGVDEVELRIERWNTASLHTAARAGYAPVEGAEVVEVIGGEPRPVQRWRWRA